MKSKIENTFAKVQKVAVETLRFACKQLIGLIPVMMLAFWACEKEDTEDFCLSCNEMLPVINETLDYLNADTDDRSDESKLKSLAGSLLSIPAVRTAYVYGIESNVGSKINSASRPSNYGYTLIDFNPFVSEIAIEFEDRKIPQKILQISMQEPWEVDGFIDFNYKTYSNSNSDPAKAILGKWGKIACGFNGKIDSDCKNFRPPGSYLEFLPNGTWRYYHPIGGDFMLGFYTVGKSSIVAYQVFTNCIVSYGQCETYRFFNKDKLEFKSCVPVWENDFYDDIKPNYYIYQRKN